MQQAGDIAKSAVAVVVVEAVFISFVGTAALGVAGPVCHVEVEPAVAVVVAPRGGLAVGFVPHARLRGDINKALSRFVVEEGVAAPVEHVKVEPAVVVVVGKGGATADGVWQGNGLGVGGTAKSAVAVVAEEAVCSGGVADVEIDPAVSIIVAPRLTDGAVVALAGVDNACRTADVGE